MINSRKIEDLHPHVASLCRKFIEQCKEAGVDVLVTSTYRDFEQQDATYAQGRTTPGSVVTCAKAGKSWRPLSLACRAALPTWAPLSRS